MPKIVLQRIVSLLPTLFLATFGVFALQHLSPIDPAAAALGENATQESVAELRHEMGLDRPFVVQYLDWMGDVARGDLGRSISSFEPVSTSVARTFPVTLQIVLSGVLLAVVVGVPLGTWAAANVGRRIDRILSTTSIFGVSVPNFWLALLLVSTMAVARGWFPAVGFVPLFEDPVASLRHTVLPAIVVAASGVATVMRQTRGALLEVMGSDFIRAHRAKGVSRSVVLWKHGLRNSGVTIVTVVGLLVNVALGATVVIESVFALPGMGQQVVRAALQNDFPMTQGIVLVFVAVVLVTNLAVDLSYRLIDPRMR